ncbi:MAG: hypothetical protein U0325_09360 [Polyangiales bacterium]
MRAAIVVLMLLGCGNRSRATPARASAPGTLNLGATAVNPEIHINPAGDAGATQIQIGNVNTRLPGENERAQQAAQGGE